MAAERTPKCAQPRQPTSRAAVVLENANRKRGNSWRKDRDGRTPGAIPATTRRCRRHYKAKRGSDDGHTPVITRSRGRISQRQVSDGRLNCPPTNDLYAATAFKVAGRSSLAQANRTAKQTLNHCNSDIENRAMSQ